jgi:hypothetical protein
VCAAKGQINLGTEGLSDPVCQVLGMVAMYGQMGGGVNCVSNTGLLSSGRCQWLGAASDIVLLVVHRHVWKSDFGSEVGQGQGQVRCQKQICWQWGQGHTPKGSSIKGMRILLLSLSAQIDKICTASCTYIHVVS